MKAPFLLLFFILTGLFCRAQQSEYQLRVAEVESYPVAKPLISIIRSHYNTDNEPRFVTVVFDQSAKELRIISAEPLLETELKALLDDYSYTITRFALRENQEKSPEHE